MKTSTAGQGPLAGGAIHVARADPVLGLDLDLAHGHLFAFFADGVLASRGQCYGRAARPVAVTLEVPSLGRPLRDRARAAANRLDLAVRPQKKTESAPAPGALPDGGVSAVVIGERSIGQRRQLRRVRVELGVRRIEGGLPGHQPWHGVRQVERGEADCPGEQARPDVGDLRVADRLLQEMCLRGTPGSGYARRWGRERGGVGVVPLRLRDRQRDLTIERVG